MELIQIIALTIFLVSIGLIIWGKIDRAIIGLIGAALMVLLGVMDESQAFLSVDWNVIAILFGIWIIASYFGQSGIPQYLAVISTPRLRRAANISQSSSPIFETSPARLSGWSLRRCRPS